MKDTLMRNKERPFLFVKSNERKKYNSILAALVAMKSGIMAYNDTETAEYHHAIIELYEYIEDVQYSLNTDESYTRPVIYTVLNDKLLSVIDSITYFQGEAIVLKLNRLVLLSFSLKRLTKKLRGKI